MKKLRAGVLAAVVLTGLVLAAPSARAATAQEYAWGITAYINPVSPAAATISVVSNIECRGGSVSTTPAASASAGRCWLSASGSLSGTCVNWTGAVSGTLDVYSTVGPNQRYAATFSLRQAGTELVVTGQLRNTATGAVHTVAGANTFAGGYLADCESARAWAYAGTLTVAS